MNKYLVDVYSPALGKHFDVRLPAGKPIGEATILLVSILESVSNGDYTGSAQSVLLDVSTGIAFDRNKTVYDAGIRNASRLMLI